MKKRLTLAILVGIVLFFGSCCNEAGNNFPTDKKEIMDEFVAGTLDPSYVPAAFFIHYDADSKIGEPAVKAHMEYILKANSDILKVQFEQGLSRMDDPTKQESWDAIEPVPLDFYRPTLEIIARLQEIAGASIYVIPTVYSPYHVATQITGIEGAKEGAVNHPEDLKRVIGYCSDALKWLVSECKKIGIQGFYMTSQGGEMLYYDIPDYFETFVKPYDLDFMNYCCEGTKMNFLHICDWEGPYDELTRFADYPGQIINTPINLNGKVFTASEGEALFKRPVLGGLDRHGDINTADPEGVKAIVRKAIEDGPAGRLMMGAECTVSSAPIENIQAAVSAAHNYGKE